jgi:hypothetical protein
LELIEEMKSFEELMAITHSIIIQAVGNLARLNNKSYLEMSMALFLLLIIPSMVITSAKAVPLTVLKFPLPDWSRQTTTPNLGQDGMYAQPDQSVRDNFECSNCGWIGRRDGGSVIER